VFSILLQFYQDLEVEAVEVAEEDQPHALLGEEVVEEVEAVELDLIHMLQKLLEQLPPEFQFHLMHTRELEPEQRQKVDPKIAAQHLRM
jgi:hypothetical protein